MNQRRSGYLPRASSLVETETATFAHKQLTLRKWERKNLPMFAPQIAVDVLLHCAAATVYGEFAAAKDFHLVTGHSKDRVREILQQLIDQGFICYLVDPRDTRVRRVMLTPRGAVLMEKYRRAVVEHTHEAVLED